MYQNGQDVPPDYAEALKWYRLAADQRYNDAHASAGEYRNTDGFSARTLVKVAPKRADNQ